MERQIHYFMGANTKDGFCSLYSELFHDPRIETVWIIKGGPGNGKSTFMRALGALAEENCAEQEYILCSSDPDSLDGLLIPKAKLAVVDGTAPHVFEPQLCGLDARYIDFSSCYRDGLSRLRDELMNVRAENKACYLPAYTCLSAAASLRQEVLRSVRAHLPKEALHPIIEGIRQALHPGSHGGIIRRFFTGFTPKGLQYRLEAPAELCDRLYILKDSYGLADEVLEGLVRVAEKESLFCIAGMSPLDPKQYEQLIFPEQRVGILRSTQQTAYHGSCFCQLDLDALCDKHLTAQLKRHIPFMLCTANALIEEAITHLQEAKALHDRLELLCRPYVDFSVASCLRERYQEKLLERLNEMA